MDLWPTIVYNTKVNLILMHFTSRNSDFDICVMVIPIAAYFIMRTHNFVIIGYIAIKWVTLIAWIFKKIVKQQFQQQFKRFWIKTLPNIS